MYTLPPMMSQQSSLELCLATSSRMNTLVDDIFSDPIEDGLDRSGSPAL
jgi:hypothetical protein